VDALFDMEHCILCFNDLNYFGLGKCNHKNVCHTCVLRLRLIMKDIKCPICKTSLDEVLIAEDQSITFEKFKQDLQKTAKPDKEDKSIFYESNKAMLASIKLRSFQCMVSNCNPGY
jgi:Zinc finger, C3HC4 type (RING finger)